MAERRKFCSQSPKLKWRRVWTFHLKTQILQLCHLSDELVQAFTRSLLKGLQVWKTVRLKGALYGERRTWTSRHSGSCIFFGRVAYFLLEIMQNVSEVDGSTGRVFSLSSSTCWRVLVWEEVGRMWMKIAREFTRVLGPALVDGSWLSVEPLYTSCHVSLLLLSWVSVYFGPIAHCVIFHWDNF